MPAARVRLAPAAALLLSIIATGGTATAQPACPKAVEAGKGIVLTSPDGRKSELRWLAGNRVRVIEENPNVPRGFPRETLTVQGLLGVEVSSASTKAKVDYQPGGDTIFPLALGKQHELTYSSRVEGQQPLQGRMIIAVLEQLEHKIGACTYEALLVARLSELDGGRRTPMRYDVYVPALQAVLKSTLFDEAANAIIETETYEFETIAAK